MRLGLLRRGLWGECSVNPQKIATLLRFGLGGHTALLMFTAVTLDKDAI